MRMVEKLSDGRGHVDPYHVDEVLAVFDAVGSEPMTAADIAEINGRSRSATHRKAKALAEEGLLQTKKTADGRRIYWRPPGG